MERSRPPGLQGGSSHGTCCVHALACCLVPSRSLDEAAFLLQVTKQGNWVDIHNAPTLVTLGVTSSEPCLPLPNVLLIARLAVHRPATRSCPWGLRHPVLSLGSRLLPLRYVRLSVQDSSRRLLRVQVVTGKVYYLRLHQAHPDAVFTLWSRLADILQQGLSITTKDPAIHVPHSLVLSVGSSSTSSPAQALIQYSKETLRTVPLHHRRHPSTSPQGPQGTGAH
uniref:Golgi associated RAB2 interactor 1A n=1 Tax=Gopherus evgoodei TaxID=1825980 RepID=A0A8C4VEV5_9SAUR